MHKRTLDKLGMTRAQADTYSRLADSIIYNNARCRAASSVIESNQQGQPGLWGFSVSGDLPIVFLELGSTPKLELVRQLLQAHAYWTSMGLQADQFILQANGVRGGEKT